MEKIERQISIESLKSRKKGLLYNTLTATTINLPILVTNNVDDMGIFSNIEFIEYREGSVNYSILNDKLEILFPNETFGFQNNQFIAIDTDGYEYFVRDINLILSDYFENGTLISGQTESRKSEVRSYQQGNPFSIGYITDNGVYVNYDNTLITFKNKVLSVNPLIYVIDGNDDLNLGTNLQNGGFIFIEDENLINSILKPRKFLLDSESRNNFNVIDQTLDTTLVDELSIIKYKSEGFNETNVVLSALTKEDIYYGLVDTPKINHDVFIRRGESKPIEMHFRFSEIKSLDHLSKYGNGFFKINKL